jgi:predicted NAD-dependent protein-ADP-ribosyltransferase YbiA (DUF1768 family)
MFPPPLERNEKSKTNGGKMDLYTLIIAQSLSGRKTHSAEEYPSQQEFLPTIDFSMLAEVRREQSEEARGEGRFVPGTAIRATA